MKTKYITWFLSLLFIATKVNSQATFQRDLSIPVTVFGSLLKLPWAGGLNTPIFSEIDLNQDGIQDLFVFDKDGFRISTYINNGTTGQFDYAYAPEYIAKFPYLHDWAILADYDCDGNADIFTYSEQGGIMIYHNDYTPGNGLSFSIYDSLLHTQYSTFFNSNLFVASVNLPAIEDVDGDGDLDVLTISNSGNFVEFHRNSAMQNLGSCGIDSFFIDPVLCWGHFGLSPFSNTALLNVCRPSPLLQGDDQNVLNGYTFADVQRSMHSGSCLLAANWNGDSLMDILNGDILGNNLLYIENGGTPDSALMVSSDSLFPSYNDAVNLVSFPHAHYFDVDNDGARDLVVSPCTPNNTENVDNVWFYKNFGTTDSSSFVKLKNTLFTDEMIELGSGANISLFDADGDGLQDILAGNYGYFSPFGYYQPRLAYFRNTGSATNPSYQLITSDYATLGNYFISAIYPTFADLDGDNDMDMLVGGEDGSLTLFTNNPTGPVANFSFDTPNYQNIDVANFAAPQLYDVNQDGKTDLLIGNQEGKIYYYENTGTISNPVFSLITANFGGVDVRQYPNNINNGFSVPLMSDSAGTLRLLVGSARGNIFYYDSINSNLTGNFHLVDSMYGKIYEPVRITMGMTDINNDGLPDLITGNQAGGMTVYTQAAGSGVGMVEEPTMQVGVYPNPANDKVTIYLGHQHLRLCSITVYNLHGEEMIALKTASTKTDVNTALWPNGVYIIRLVDESKTVINKKIVINHF